MTYRIHELSKLEYHDSRKVLLRLRDLQERVVVSELPDKVKNLRKRELKKYLEGRQAALFCYGIGNAVLNTDVFHALYESSDYDCVALWERDGEQVFMPIQLKELVPESLKSTATLANELERLAKYVAPEDLVVALHVNRKGKLEFAKIQMPRLNVAEVWLYGAISPDQGRWFLYGNLLKEPEYYEFDYPMG
jgi:hypothetical protein